MAQRSFEAVILTEKKARGVAGVLCLLMLLSACFGSDTEWTTIGHTGGDKRLLRGALPRPDHIVIVWEENTAYSQIVDNPDAPFLNKLIAEGASFPDSHGVTHPSQPNYLALFSGSTQGVSDDSCDHIFTSANLASELEKAGLSFTQYSQGLPHAGFLGCHEGEYARKHNPAVNWQASSVSPTQNRPFSDFPENFDKLPTISLVSPDLEHDMHDGGIEAGDRWLEDNLGAYNRWAMHHNSLLIVTWDEDDGHHDNKIATIAVGAMVKPGEYPQPIDHYSVLRTLETIYNLPLLGESANMAPISDIWRMSGRAASDHENKQTAQR